jgi:hypothetical protein
MQSPPLFHSLILYADTDELADELRRRAEVYLSKPAALRDRGFDLQVFCIGDPRSNPGILETRMTTGVCAKVVSEMVPGVSFGYDLRFRSSMRKEYGWVGNLGTVDPAYSQPLLADIYCIRQQPLYGHTFPMQAAVPYSDLHGARICQIVTGDGRGHDDVVVLGPAQRETWLGILERLGQSEQGRGGFGSTGK